MKFTTSWQGIEVLDMRIDRLLDLATGPEITEALMPGAELMAERWRQKVPAPGSTQYATGRYRDSIRVERGELDEFGINSLDVLTDAMNPEDGFNYPEALEFGTSKMSAYPSAIPAFDESVDEAIEAAVARLDEMIIARVGR